MAIKRGMNSNTADIIFFDENLPLFETTAKTTEESILAGIEYFTMLDDKQMEEYLGKYSSIMRLGDCFMVNFDSRQYVFRKIDPFFDDVIKQELFSRERYGQCCTASVELASISDSDCKVGIGYLNYTDFKILHAVCIIGDNVFDYTKNLIMRKEDYFELTNFEVINEVNRSDIMREIFDIENLGFIPIKVYLLYHDEVMRDLDKNKTLIKEYFSDKK